MFITQDPPTPLGVSKTNWRFVAIVIVLAALVVGACFVWQYLVTPEKYPDPESTSLAITKFTADWQTYQNEEYGFEIKFPESEQCRFLEINKGGFSFGRIELAIEDSEGLSLSDYVDKFTNERTGDWNIEAR